MKCPVCDYDMSDECIMGHYGVYPGLESLVERIGAHVFVWPYADTRMPSWYRPMCKPDFNHESSRLLREERRRYEGLRSSVPDRSYVPLGYQ